MNTRSLVATLSVCATALAISVVMSNAGPLDPPAGPIASTNKTLNEVEPRVAVNATNTPGDNDFTPSLFKITQPGSYYLTGNITGVSGKHGVEIAASSVALDLNGFALIGVAGSLDGVFVSAAVTGVAVENGAVIGWGSDGVDLSLASKSTMRLVQAVSNGDDGIVASSGAAILDNATALNTGDGIQADANSLVRGNICNGNGNGANGAGVHVTGSGNRVEGNTATNNDAGFAVDVAGNIIIKNSASNPVDYSIPLGNTVGPTVTSATISLDSNPHANYRF